MITRRIVMLLAVAISLLCSAQFSWSLNMCSTSSSTAASDDLYDSGGSFGNYQNNEDCFLLIQPAGATSITLNFAAFNLETSYDFVRIYDGSNTSAPLLATLTGNLGSPGPYTSSGGSMLVRFTSDFSITRSGIQASWTSVLPPSVLDHFAIIHDQVAATCAEESITVTAHDTVERDFTGYTGNVTVTARDTVTNNSAGSWSLLSGNNPGSFVDNGDGTASYQYVSSDNGTATFGYTQTTPRTINFDVTDGSITESASEDNNLVVADALSVAGNFRDEFGGGDYRDDFNSVAYNNSDGRVDWSSNGWIETDPSGGGASGGDVEISNGRLELTGNNLNPTVKASAEREVDLTGYTSAVFRFTLQTTSVESNDISTVAVSSNGGATWTTIFTFADDVPVSRPFSYDITPFISSNTRIRFRIEDENGGACCYGPSDEILQIDSVEISSATTSRYSNNDGSLSWAGSWQESDGDGAGSGPVSIYADQLYLYGSNSSLVTVSRAADLSPYGDATLTFDYEADGNVDSTDEVLLQVSAGGSGWVTLRTYQGNVSGSDSVSLLGYLAADTQIRFVIDDPGTGGSCCYNSSDEAFIIDNVDITVYTPLTCISGPDHFNISHAGNAVNCQAEPITIEAHLADDTVDSAYTGTISLSTSTGNGDWFLQNGTSIASGSDTGNATYTFAAGDNGEVTLLLRNTNEETLSINVTDGTATETTGTATASEDPDLTFNPTGFRFYDGNTSTPIATQLSGKDSNVSGQGLQSSLYLQAINTNSQTGACEALLVGDQDIEFSFECLDPASCAGTNVEIQGVPISESTNGTTAVSLNFGAATPGNDTAAFVFNYQDAGRIRLNVADLPLTPSNSLVGTSADFVVKPAGFCVEAIGPGADCSSSPGPLNACSVYTKAGENFELRVSAMNWPQPSDTDGDFCNNIITPNFRSDNIALSSTVADPALEDIGSLSVTLIDIPLGGVLTQVETFSEVGVYTFTATSPSYLATGAVTGTSANVGRFIPHHFVVTNASLVNRTDPNTQGSNCAVGYTFLDEELSLAFDIEAHNLNGVITENYKGDYAKLNGTLALGDNSSNDSDAINVVAQLGTTVYYPGNRLSGSGPVISMTDGTTALSSGTPGVTLSVAVDRLSVGGGFDAETVMNNVEFLINPIDSDDVESNGSETINMLTPEDFTSIDSTDLYFGRIVVEDAYGPETRPLPMWVHSEYCTAVDTSTTPDSCTAWQDLNQRVDPSQDACSQLDLTQPLTDITVAAWDGNSYPAGSTNVLFQAFDAVVNRGGGGWSLNYTGSASSYQVMVPALGTSTVNNYHPYLLLKQGQANFGSFRGHDRIIYWRENHNP